jgi:hypothetical protein
MAQTAAVHAHYPLHVMPHTARCSGAGPWLHACSVDVTEGNCYAFKRDFARSQSLEVDISDPERLAMRVRGWQGRFGHADRCRSRFRILLTCFRQR